MGDRILSPGLHTKGCVPFSLSQGLQEAAALRGAPPGSTLACWQFGTPWEQYMNHNAAALAAESWCCWHKEWVLLVASGSLPGSQLDGPVCFRGACGKRVAGESGSAPLSEAAGVSSDAAVLLVYVEGQPCPRGSPN